MWSVVNSCWFSKKAVFKRGNSSKSKPQITKIQSISNLFITWIVPYGIRKIELSFDIFRMWSYLFTSLCLNIFRTDNGFWIFNHSKLWVISIIYNFLNSLKMIERENHFWSFMCPKYDGSLVSRIKSFYLGDGRIAYA